MAKLTGKARMDEEQEEKQEETQTSQSQLDKMEKFSNEVGLEYDKATLEEAENTIKVSVENGSVSLKQYKQLLLMKMYEYNQMGILWKVQKMMEDQSKQKPARSDLIYMAKEMAEKELKFGLVPIQHTIPLQNKLYILIEGRRYHARKMGGNYSVKYEVMSDGTDDNLWKIKCIVKVGNNEFESVGKATPSDVYNKKWIEEMAYKRALAHALDMAFPLGASYEDAEMDMDLSEEKEEEEKKITNDIKEL